VLIAPDRRLAVINGQQYSEGATYRDGRVLRISESEVVIRRPGGDEALKLYPQDVKRASGSADEGK
jgi:MSHA biogenesis protein MshK